MTGFSMLGLSEPLMRALDADGFITPTEIQQRSIPVLLDGNDFVGLAETGTGKTAAFLLPLIHHLIESPQMLQPGKPRALILAPTRELAQQIIVVMENLSRFTPLKSTVIFGGAPMHKQVRRLRGGLDLLVATPGRLMDHMRQGNVSFDHTQFFILDEADRMLDMGFIPDVKTIAAELPKSRQTVLFSATMNKAVSKLTPVLLNNPVRVDVSRKIAISEAIDHRVLHVAAGKKLGMLRHLVNGDIKGQMIVFTKTKRGADKLSRDLGKNGLRTDAIHGDRNQRQRMRTLQRFREGSVDILIATDVAARGIDVPGIACVINYDLPLEPESYIHRVGRTGRNGAEGRAFSLCTQEDMDLLYGVEKLIKSTISVDRDHPFHCEPTPLVGKPAARRSRARPSFGKNSRNGGRSKAKGQGKFDSGSRSDGPRKGPARNNEGHNSAGKPTAGGASHGAGRGPKPGGKRRRKPGAPRRAA